jgi:molybdopterin molybdotransferase
MRRLFDAYVAVDWSARSKPSRVEPAPDAISVGEKDAAGMDSSEVGEVYFRTRHTCCEYLRERLRHYVAQQRRVFIGFDFPYGYPAGFAAALGLSSDLPAWRLIWDEIARLIEDDARNHNNRFEVGAELNARCGGNTPGPFWGCPRRRQSPALQMTT